jgi:hypothetical protein
MRYHGIAHTISLPVTFLLKERTTIKLQQPPLLKGTLLFWSTEQELEVWSIGGNNLTPGLPLQTSLSAVDCSTSTSRDSSLITTRTHWQYTMSLSMTLVCTTVSWTREPINYTLYISLSVCAIQWYNNINTVQHLHDCLIPRLYKSYPCMLFGVAIFAIGWLGILTHGNETIFLSSRLISAVDE